MRDRQSESFARRGKRGELSALIMLLLMGSSTFAQSGDAVSATSKTGIQLGDVLRMADEARKRGNELTVLDTLRALETQLGESDRQGSVAIADVSYHFDAVVGNYRDALRHFSVARGSRRQPLPSADEYPLRDLRPRSALDVLDAKGSEARIIMINEAHHVPQHRAFTIQLLERLRKKGFQYFAAESLGEDDKELQSRGYPTQKTGYYTAEPVYGDLVRTALRLGYRVVPYEGTSFKNAEEREQAQVTNLVDRIFRNEPDAKVVIHAGYSHVNESGLLAGVPPLAMRLKEITGRDPLTIDQTVMSEQFSEEYEHPVYQYLMAHAPISRPTLFVNAKGEPWTTQPGVRDVTLFHPRSVYVDGRPTWLELGGARKRYKLPPSVCGAEKRCLVKARFAGESADAIPIDALEITDAAPVAALMLPKGAFVIDVQDPSGKSLSTLRVTQR